jgi:hypothetical protein
MGVTDDHGPPGEDVVDIFPAVDIEDPGSPGLIDEPGRRTDGAKCPDRAVDASGYQLLRTLKQDL